MSPDGMNERTIDARYAALMNTNHHTPSLSERDEKALHAAQHKRRSKATKRLKSQSKVTT